MLERILSGDVFGFLLVFARVGSALMLLPGFGEAFVSARVRLVASLAISLVVYPVVAAALPALPATPIALFLVVGGEIVVGLFIGTLSRILIGALQTAGSVIAVSASMANAFTFDPVTQSQGSVVSRFLTTLAALLILVTDLHHVALRALVDSYTLFVPGAMLPLDDLSRMVLRTVAHAFGLAIQLSMPVLVIGFLFSVSLGLMTRLMPQAQIFTIGMPIQIGLGLVVFMLTLSSVMLLFLENYAAFYGGLLSP